MWLAAMGPLRWLRTQSHHMRVRWARVIQSQWVGSHAIIDYTSDGRHIAISHSAHVGAITLAMHEDRAHEMKRMREKARHSTKGY